MTDSPQHIEVGRAIAPGDYLRTELSARHMSQSELARRMGRPAQVVSEIINRKKSLTEETALELERVLGTPAAVWVQLEARFQLALARDAEIRTLQTQAEWLRHFPVREMERRGWLPSGQDTAERVRALLQFFGVASFSNWGEYEETLGFRITGGAKVDAGALAAWVRQGELAGAAVQTAEYNEASFRRVLQRARSLTKHPPQEAWTELRRLCASAGVAAIVLPEFPKIGANGVARWLTPHKALIQLNLRYRWADIFWFTFFHEAAHVLMHEPRRVIVEIEGNPRRDLREAEANHLAEEILIPSAVWEDFVLGSDFRPQAVTAIATSLNIHPGIVVGRLQHQQAVPWHSKLNALRSRLAWVEDDQG